MFSSFFFISCCHSYEVVVFIFLWHAGSKCDPILGVVFLLVLNSFFLQCCLRSLPFETYSARGTVSRKSWALLWLLLEHARVFYEAGSDVLTHKTGSCHWTPIVPCSCSFPFSVTTRKFASAPLFRFLCAAQVLLTVTLDLSLSELFTSRNAASCWQLGLLKSRRSVCMRYPFVSISFTFKPWNQGPKVSRARPKTSKLNC